jgi:hypothetical protein
MCDFLRNRDDLNLAQSTTALQAADPDSLNDRIQGI